MEFLNPTALYGALALPLLLIPYLVRRKPRRMIFSSLLLFAEMGPRASARPWGKLRLPPIFFLQLLLLTLLILALGEPVFSVRPTNIAILLDNSASMQTLEDGKTRFALAVEKARGLLSDLGITGKVDFYRTVPRLEKVHASVLSPSEAAGVLATLAPYDLGDVPVDYNNLFGQLAKDRKYDRVYLITDHPERGQSGNFRVISVGESKGNLGIASFQLTRSSLLNSRLQAAAEVTNFSSKDERMRVVLKGGGVVLANRELVVGAGKNAVATFEGFPLHAYYEVEIDRRDALLLDNRRFAVVPKSQSLHILGISPRPQALASLRSIPGVSLDIISPGDYEKTERSGYDLEIFHFSAPAALPAGSGLFVLPPDNNALVNLQKPIARPAVSSWREPHTLTRYVNFALFRPSYARPLMPKTPGESIIESPEGPLAFAVERQGGGYLVLGFDPFPYLGRDNLPVSIFTLNLLDWFFEGTQGKGNATGEPLTFAPARQGDLLVTPKGEKVPLKAAATNFPGTLYQGVYQVNRGAERELFAVNLRDSNESDLRAPSPIELRDQSNIDISASALFSIWPYLLSAFLLLLIVEWFIHPRVASSGLRLRSIRRL